MNKLDSSLPIKGKKEAYFVMDHGKFGKLKLI